MSAPSTYLRKKREEAARRRLELAKMLRGDPNATNKQLAKALNVNRDTIALDRKTLMEQLQKDARTETEQLRAKLHGELEELKWEVEQHRNQGKLPLSAVDRLLDITKAIIELTGARKPVVEKHEVKHQAPISFNTVIVGTDGKEKPPRTLNAEVIKEPFALGDGND